MAPSHVLVIHSSRFGLSKRIAEAISEEIEAGGIGTDSEELSGSTAPDPARHRAVVVVMSVRYGHFDANVARFVAKNRAWLDSVPTLLVTVSLTARTPEKRDPAVHVYTRKFLEKTAWTPNHTEVVAGALEYPRYNFLDRIAIQMIMHITHGPTDPSLSIEYTDWDRVREVGREFANTLGGLT